MYCILALAGLSNESVCDPVLSILDSRLSFLALITDLYYWGAGNAPVELH